MASRGCGKIKWLGCEQSCDNMVVPDKRKVFPNCVPVHRTGSRATRRSTEPLQQGITLVYGYTVNRWVGVHVSMCPCVPTVLGPTPHFLRHRPQQSVCATVTFFHTHDTHWTLVDTHKAICVSVCGAVTETNQSVCDTSTVKTFTSHSYSSQQWQLFINSYLWQLCYIGRHWIFIR